MLEGKTIIKGFVWTSLTQCASIFFKFLSLIILSRLLSPKEYGLLAIITIFMELGFMIADSGMGASLIKKRDSSHIDYDTLFIYNICVGLFIYVLLWFCAPLIANIYNESIITWLIRIASLQIIIHCLYAPQFIQILKSLDFFSIAIATVISSSLGLISAIILAYRGFGVWALVTQTIIESVALLAYYTGKNRFVPKLRFSKNSFQEQFGFGINLLFTNTLNTISNNIFNNVVAKIATLQTAGLFVQANRIQNLPVSVTTSIIDRALFPILSKTEDKEEKEKVYFRVYRIVVLLTTFITLYISIFSKELVICILGDKWLATSKILSVLALAIIPLALQAVCRNALKSEGKTFAILKNQILKTTILFFSLVMGYFGGFDFLVVGIVLSQVLASISILKLTTNLTGMSFRKHFSVLLPYLFISIISCFFVALVIDFLNLDRLIYSLLMSIIFSSLCYYLLLMIIKDPVINSVGNKVLNYLKEKK